MFKTTSQEIKHLQSTHTLNDCVYIQVATAKNDLGRPTNYLTISIQQPTGTLKNQQSERPTVHTADLGSSKPHGTACQQRAMFNS